MIFAIREEKRNHKRHNSFEPKTDGIGWHLAISIIVLIILHKKLGSYLSYSFTAIKD